MTITADQDHSLPEVSELKLERSGSVLWIWLNRPQVHNALSAQMASELGAVLAAIKNDRSIRAVVLRGAGGTFCAGGDIKGFKDSMQTQMQHAEVAASNRTFGELLMQVNELPQVTIMLVEGAAIGGGLGLACVGDVTIVEKSAKFRVSETSLGIPPAQIAPFITERVGLTTARRLMLTGARFNGEEALALGIAHFVVDDARAMDAQCAQVLKQISYCAPNANAVTKAIIFEATRQPLTQALDFAAKGFAGCMLSDEGREGVAAFVEKRKPSWSQDDE